MVRRRFIKPAILVLLLLVMGLWAAYRIMLAVPPSPGPFPSPNGYEDIIEAGKLVPDHKDLEGYKDWEPERLRTCVSTNSAVLSLLRRGLSKECRVKTEYTRQYLDYHTVEIMNLGTLERLLEMEAVVAERENRLSDALSARLDRVHLGYEQLRGGVLIDALVGTAIILRGSGSIDKMLPQLDAGACKETALKLEKFYVQRESIESIKEQERRWSIYSAPAYERIKEWWDERAVRKILKAVGSSVEDVQQRWGEVQTSALRLAIHAYQLDKGRPPAAIADLVPEYLSTIPKDAITGKPLPFPPPIVPNANGGK